MPRAGSKAWQAMVVMTKGRNFQQQSYKVAAQFPCEWVRRKHNDGFMITCCGTIGSRDNYYWVVVVTAGTGYDSQAVELEIKDFHEDDARCMSPRRNSQECEDLFRDAHRVAEQSVFFVGHSAIGTC